MGRAGGREGVAEGGRRSAGMRDDDGADGCSAPAPDGRLAGRQGDRETGRQGDRETDRERMRRVGVLNTSVAGGGGSPRARRWASC